MIPHGGEGDPDPAEDPANPSPAHGDYPPAYPIPPVPKTVKLSPAATRAVLRTEPTPVMTEQPISAAFSSGMSS